MLCNEYACKRTNLRVCASAYLMLVGSQQWILLDTAEIRNFLSVFIRTDSTTNPIIFAT